METPLIEPDEVPEREIRISARLSAQSRLSPEELERTIVEVKAAAEREQERLSHRLADPLKWYRRPGVAVALVVVAVIIWGVQLWVWKPDVRRTTAQEKEGGMRFAVVLQAARIQDYWDRTGHLPRSIREVDGALDGVGYQQLDTLLYRLTIRDSTMTLTWRSDSSLRDFLGPSIIRMKETKLK
jgi:hypothetical protein